MGKKTVRNKRVTRNKVDQWFFEKAKNYRSRWRERCKKISGKLEDVPVREEIEQWLKLKKPFRCYMTGKYLDKRSMEADHIIPINRNGNFSLSNIGLTSKRMNQIKGDMTFEEFKSLLDIVNTWEDKGERLFKRLLASNNIYRRKR